MIPHWNCLAKGSDSKNMFSLRNMKNISQNYSPYLIWNFACSDVLKYENKSVPVIILYLFDGSIQILTKNIQQSMSFKKSVKKGSNTKGQYNKKVIWP